MKVILKNNAKCPIIIPGVGELAKLEGLVVPEDTVVIDSALIDEYDFIKHCIERGDLVRVGEQHEAGDSELEALREQADMLGIQHNKRWGTAKFREEIAKLTDSE